MPPSPPDPKQTGTGARRQTDIRVILDEPPEPGAIREPRAIVPQRRQTFPGIPGLPIEYASTMRAPSLTAPTLPAKADPTGIRIPSDEAAPQPSLAPPSATPDAAALVASRADAERLRTKVAELERNARAVADTKTVSFPPPVMPSPAPAVATSREPETEAVIAWLVKRGVANRKAIMAIIAVLGIGGGGAAIKAAADTPGPSQEALRLSLETEQRAHGVTKAQVKGLLDREAQREAYDACRDELQEEVNKMLLPAADRVGNALPMKPWVNRCSKLKPLP